MAEDKLKVEQFYLYAFYPEAFPYISYTCGPKEYCFEPFCIINGVD